MHGYENPTYLNRAQEYTDALAAIGEPVKDKDLVMLVVSSLREEYNSLKTTITARQSPTAFSELHALLSDHDYMLGKTHTPIAPYGPQAFYGARPSNNNKRNNNNNSGSRNNSRGNNNRGRDNGRRFDWASTQNTVYGTCNRCDTRANSHVTPDLEAMDNSEAYYGDDALHVGNGKGLPIRHIGSSKVYSPQKTFSLKNILHAKSPTICLSVQNFCHDNDVFFEFHTSYFVVKDESKHTTLLTGPSKHGLYTITLPQLKTINKGPVPLLSFEGHRYFMLCVDHHSRYMWIYHLAQKSDVYSTFKSFVQMVERQFTTKLKNVQIYWDGEFRNLASFLSSLGIIHRRSCPHTSEQNGYVECHNRHVVETGLTLLAQACVPQRFWHYAFDTAIYLINRMPSRTSTNKSPFEYIFKWSPDYSLLRVFGCLCFPHLRPYNCHKMDFRSTPCVFLGYNPSHHGYRCLDISTERLYITRHVRVNEAQFPFDIPKTTSPPLSKTSPYYSSESPYVIPTTNHPSPSSPRSPISSPSSVSHLSPTSQTSPDRQHPANFRQNPKQRVPYNPFTNHATVLPTTITEPTSFTVANNSPEWRQAMKEEYDALMKNGTWSLVPRASNTNVVDGKWVYRLKRDKNGAITRYKARFVAKGFWQQPGIDFHEKFSPVVKSTTIQAVLSLAVTNDWPLRQLDIQNAFLHGNLKEQVYMKQPPGFIDPQRPNHVCLLHKSLCGLKQAPHAWFERLSKALFDLGIEIVPHVFGILLSQKKYILELLQSASLSNCNPVSSPMVTSSSLSLDDSTAFSNPVKYRQVVGSLDDSTNSLIRRSSGSTLQAFTDVLCKDDLQSTGGFTIYLGSNLISWTACKQRKVSRSSKEAKYKALADTVAELTWLQALLNELGIRSSSTPILWCDNLGATYLYLYKAITNSSILLFKIQAAVIAASSFEIKAQTCKPSGGITGKKPPAGQCNRENDSDCCVQGKFYTTYTCSPPVTGGTKDTLRARLVRRIFQKGGDGDSPSECDKHYHLDDTPVVALSTGWYKGGDRCHKYITIYGNGRSVKAMVVDECDSTMGCDDEHDYQLPCPNNIVDASKAVWKALGAGADLH
ncbi:putative RNA-directed DNA polymerase [Tanacetum coccineum]